MSSSDDEKSTNKKPAASSPSSPTSPTAATPSSSNNASRERSILYFQPSPKVKKMAKDYRTEIAASSSSMVATIIAYPLDFVKSRMQGYQIDVKTAVLDAYRKEGPRAFWRGVVPPTLSIAFVRTLSFKCFSTSKYWLDDRFFEVTGRSPLVHAATPGRLPTWDTVSLHALSGMVAGSFVTCFSCPFELTKLNMQLAGKEARDREIKTAQKNGNTAKTSTKGGSDIPKQKKPGSLALFRSQWKQGGFSRCFAGFHLHLARDVIGTAVYFSTYETTKQTLNNFPGLGINNAAAIAVAGAACGMTSWAVIIPIDAAKTTYQKARLAAAPGVHIPMPPINYFKRQSYRGLGVSCMRSAVINMIFFTIYESVKSNIDRLNGDEPRRGGRKSDVD